MSMPLFRRWRGPRLAVQIVALMLGGLVVAQFVTLLLTMLLPPAPTPQYDLATVAAALRGGTTSRNLEHVVQSGPPDLGGPGWLTSERSRKELAGLLSADPIDVRLSFYTPLPFAGTVGPRKVVAMLDDGPIAPAQAALRLGWREGDTRSMIILAQAPGGAPGPMPGGGHLPPNAGPPNRDMLPPGSFPPGPRRGGQQGDNRPVMRAPTTDDGGALIRLDPNPVQGRDGVWIGGDRGEAVPPIFGTRPGTTPETPNAIIQTNPQVFQQGPQQIPGVGPNAPGGQFLPGGPRFPTIVAPSDVIRQLAPADRSPASEPIIEQQHAASGAPRFRPARPAIEQAAPTPDALPAPSRETPAYVEEPARHAEARIVEPALPLQPRPRGLFGLAPSPFVEGDFVAALRQADGSWSVVKPAAEPFPNSWQRRVLLWFLIAFGIVAPLGWLFARRMSKPLAAFAEAAEQLGRDPTAPVLDLDGPAEVGRAAHAFNLMQSRLKSFVGDRTAMIGAISHDLRTPLTRLRFRIEEVEDEGIRDGMIEEVEEMEEMIGSVLAFIRDASTAGVRERIDLRAIVEDVAEDAAIVGNDVTLDAMPRATIVDVDVMGMRRLFANLFENAAKYGERARVRLATENGEAVAQVIDEGPGVPEDDLERAFEPFYRAANARATDKRGSGLGLAVCRSIARAHGGDVKLKRSADGFAAELRLPLAYEAAEVEPA